MSEKSSASSTTRSRSHSRSRSPQHSSSSLPNHRRRRQSLTSATSERTNDSTVNTSTNATIASEEEEKERMDVDEENDSDWNEDDDEKEQDEDDIDDIPTLSATSTAQFFSSILRQLTGQSNSTNESHITTNNIQQILEGLAQRGLLHQDEYGNFIMSAGDEDVDIEDVEEEDESENEESNEQNNEATEGEAGTDGEPEAPEPIQRDAAAIEEYARYAHLDRNHLYPLNVLESLHSIRNYHDRPTPSAQLAALSARHIPNICTSVERFDGRAFCGKFSHGSTEGANSMFACATQDGLIHLFHTDTFKRYKQIAARDVGWSIVDIDFSTDSRFVVYSSWSNNVHLINTTGEYELHEELNFDPHHSSLQHCCMFGIRFSTNESREILAGLNGGISILYDIERKRKIWSAVAHDDDINTVCWLDDSGNLFATGSDDSAIHIWDRRLLGNSDSDTAAAPTPQTRRGYVRAKPVSGFIGHVHGITSVAPMPDGNARYLLSNSKDQSMKLWDLRRAMTSHEMDSSNSDRAPQGRMLDYRWQRLSRRQIASSARAARQVNYDSSVTTFTGHAVTQTLIRCDFSPLHSTGCRYAISGSADGIIYIYDILSGEVVERIRGHQGIVRDVAWHDHIILSSSWDHTIRRHALHNEKLTQNPVQTHGIGRFGMRRRVIAGDEDEEE